MGMPVEIVRETFGGEATDGTEHAEDGEIGGYLGSAGAGGGVGTARC